MRKLKIELYTCGWNEEYQLPFAIEYWKRFITDETDFKVIYYDNFSNDKSLEILSKYPWIEVRMFDTGGEMNEELLTIIRNNCWKGSTADFVIVCDVDEQYYAKDIVKELKELKKKGAAVVACQWYALVGDKESYNTDTLLHKQIGRGYRQHINHRQDQSMFGKLQLFDPKQVSDMHYSVGMHFAFPDAPITVSYNIYQFHFDKGYNLDWNINRRKIMWKRLADSQKAKGFCVHYGLSEDKIIQEYKANQEKSIDISDI